MHASVEAGHRRVLASVFGPVGVERMAYRPRGHRTLHPADAYLNLPLERHSHGLRRLAVIESSRGSFEQAAAGHRQGHRPAPRNWAQRLSKGEKRNRKRMAEVGAVYGLKPVPRRPTDVLPAPGGQSLNKAITASVTDDAAEVIAAVFDQADRRDPHHQRPWVALVDGNRYQFDRIT